MNCALRQNRGGGGDGRQMIWGFDGHSLPGDRLISLLAPGPNPHTGLYEVPWYTTRGKAGEIYRSQSP